jgi:uncharacterized protein involved in response to NO
MPLLRLAFRPFYLGAAASAVVLMLLWPAVYAGRLALATGIAPVLWHAHEMLFGFVAAVVVGFLLTAGKTWTQLPTPRGRMLGFLFLLWAGARVAAVVAPYAVFFYLDVVFLPLIAALFIDLLVRAKNWRNLAIAGVLALLSIANLFFHLASSKALGLDPMRALHGGLALLVLLETLIAGRVIPMFTASVNPGLRVPRHAKLESAVPIATVSGLALWVFDGPAMLSAVVLFLAAALQAARALSWFPWKSKGRPILWMLHASYAWMPAGLAMLAAARIEMMPLSAAVHALAVGATGGLVLSMMTRTARGHTGRPVVASRLEVAAYGCLAAAALLRVLASMSTAVHLPALLAAGSLWIAAFALYLRVFTPWLMTARADGRDG